MWTLTELLTWLSPQRRRTKAALSAYAAPPSERTAYDRAMIRYFEYEHTPPESKDGKSRRKRTPKVAVKTYRSRRAATHDIGLMLEGGWLIAAQSSDGNRTTVTFTRQPPLNKARPPADDKEW